MRLPPRRRRKREDRIAAREKGQADNLVTKIFKDRPTAKVLIYVGYSHAAEAPIGEKKDEWMAARLKKMTGIDPLTIGQSTLTDTAETASDRHYHGLVAAKASAGPVILMQGSTPVVIGSKKGAFDLQVVHPATRLVDGRPDWLAGMGRRPVPIPKHLLPAKGRRLVQAFIAGEAKDSVPVDQVVVEAGKPAPVLMLPEAEMRYAVQDARPSG